MSTFYSPESAGAAASRPVSPLGSPRTAGIWRCLTGIPTTNVSATVANRDDPERLADDFRGRKSADRAGAGDLEDPAVPAEVVNSAAEQLGGLDALVMSHAESVDRAFQHDRRELRSPLHGQRPSHLAADRGVRPGKPGTGGSSRSPATTSSATFPTASRRQASIASRWQPPTSSDHSASRAMPSTPARRHRLDERRPPGTPCPLRSSRRATARPRTPPTSSGSSALGAGRVDQRAAPLQQRRLPQGLSSLSDYCYVTALTGPLRRYDPAMRLAPAPCLAVRQAHVGY